MIIMPDGQKHFDVAIIGGGPAGMISAGRAGELGASVILIEKNKNLGRKLLVTGSDKSQDVLETLIGYLKKSNVKIKLN